MNDLRTWQIDYIRENAELFDGLIGSKSKRVQILFAVSVFLGVGIFPAAFAIMEVFGNQSQAVGAVPLAMIIGLCISEVWRRRETRDIVGLRDDRAMFRMEALALESDEPAPAVSADPFTTWRRLIMPAKIRDLKMRLRRTDYWMYTSALLTIFFVTLAIIGAAVPSEKLGFGGTAFLVGGLFYATIAAIWALSRFSLRAEIANEIERAEIDLELSQGQPVGSSQERAEKLFRLNQTDVTAYYQLMLNHNKVSFAVGLLCIAAGLAVAVVTMLVITGDIETAIGDTAIGANGEPLGDPDFIKGLVAAVGAVSAIMVQFVAAIYLRMQVQASRGLSEFHERMVRTSDLFLANVIVERMDDSDDKQTTISKLALSIVGAGGAADSKISKAV